MLEIRLLGRFEVRLDGVMLEIPSRPAQALLAYLALNAGTAQRREKLAGLLWPDASEDNARTYLRQALWRLRSAIGSEALRSNRMTVTFSPNTDYWLDAGVLESEPAEDWTADTLIAAVSVYDGDLLPGFYEDWVVLERERLQAVYQRRMEALLDELIGQKRWSDVRKWGERWIATGQVPEPAYRALMVAYAGTGDLASVATVYQRCAQALEDELGVTPSDETTSLYHSLIQRDGSDSTSAVESAAALPKKRSPSLPAFLEPESVGPPSRREPFIGRERELTTLHDHLEGAVNGRGRVVFVTGEAGQGKTTLLQEFVRRAQVVYPDLIVAAGACPIYTSVSAPYAVFREILAMLAGDLEPAWVAGTISREQAVRLWQLLPDTIGALLQHGPNLINAFLPAEDLIQRAISAPVDQDRLDQLNALATRSTDGGGRLSQQGELFAEYTEVLIAVSSHRPLLLVLDDLHWADASSIGLLSHLGHRLAQVAILVLSAHRPEEVSQGREGEPHPLAPVLGEFKRRFGDVHLALDDAEIGGGRPFVDALLDTQPNALADDFRTALTRHTGGHALFTVELLRDMQERGTLQKNEADEWALGSGFTWEVIPPRVEGVIETRVNRLDPELRLWLEVASVEGEFFTAEVVARVRGVDAGEVVRRLSGELDKQHRLVAARGVRRAGARRLAHYQFRHNLFREYLYTRLDDIERPYLHEQVGEALEQIYAQRSGEIADQLAHHFQMAEMAEKALTYLMQAGQAASRVYANEEAISFFSQALTLAKDPEEQELEEDVLITLYLQLGRALEHNSDFKQALAVYRNMEDLGRERALNTLLLMALTAQGTLYAIPSPVHEPKQARKISEQALPLAGELNDRAAQAKILWILMFACEYDNQLAEAIAYGERSLVLARELDPPDQLAYTLNDLAGCHWVAGNFARGIDLFREAEAIWRAAGNLPMLADVLHSCSIAFGFAGNYDEALAQTEESWRISQSIGNKWGLVQSRARIAFVHRERGEPAHGIAVTMESLRLAEAYRLEHEYAVPMAELAFTYSRLGAGARGLDVGRQGLEASNRYPAYRPYLLAALVQCHLAMGEIEPAESTVQQARSDPYWQAFPAYCIALDLAEGRLALAKGREKGALKIAEALLANLRQFGMRSYLPAALDISGTALLGMGNMAEARTRFLEARAEAEAMGAKDSLWPILLHLSQTESDAADAAQLRHEARELVNYIADHSGSPELRDSFMALPDVRLLVESMEGP